MIKSKKVKNFLLTSTLTLSITLALPFSASAATYKVTSGDTLYKIGQLFNTTASTLVKSNNLTSTALNIGQILNVSCETYTVQKGDTLFYIAQKFSVSLDALRKANSIYTNYIEVSQVLNIPASATSSTTITPVVNYTAAELDLLSRLIYAEARGESYKAKVAVGAVVVNRVKSGLFVNTISGVINQNINGYYQFCPVANGMINNTSSAECIQAAKEALSGVDPTNGALFFYDTTTTNNWLLSKTVALAVDHIVFAY